LTSKYTKDLQIFNAQQFRNSLSNPAYANVYFTFGQVTPWPIEQVPADTSTSNENYYSVWKKMIGAKRITGNDVKNVIPRYNWTANTVYNAYDSSIDSLDMMQYPFYVVTTDWNVYKCLSNNYGAVSMAQPTSTATISDFQTTDGYIWKYMYTISTADSLNYTTNDFIPVKTLTLNDGSSQWLVQDYATAGSIDIINLTNFGSGYTSNDVSVIITGDGSEANAFAQVNTTTGMITSIIVDNRGTNYTYANVNIYQANSVGSGATAKAMISPPGGHGSDPLNELGGSYLLLNLELKSDESGILLDTNKYRQIGIISNPTLYATTVPVSDTVVSQLTVITLNGTSANYIENEYVYQGSSLANANFYGIVAQWDSPNNIIKLTNVQGTPSSDLLVGKKSTAARFLQSIKTPAMQIYSGQLLYINNITPIARSIDQTESFKIVLTF